MQHGGLFLMLSTVKSLILRYSTTFPQIRPLPQIMGKEIFKSHILEVIDVFLVSLTVVSKALTVEISAMLLRPPIGWAQVRAEAS